MRAVIQRVRDATCSVEGSTTGSISQGLLVFLGIQDGDDADQSKWLLDKILTLRVFEDETGKMNRSLKEVEGGILLIPQFTLFGSVCKGTRPSFNRAAPPDFAQSTFEMCLDALRATHGCERVAAGVFGAAMQITAHNDGPVTLIIDSHQRDF